MTSKRTLGPFLLSWAAMAVLPGFCSGQGTKASSTPEPSTQKKVFQGEARLSVHSYEMEQGGVYRITVRADGFAPQLRIDGQNSEAFVGLTGVYVLNPISTKVANPSAASGTRQEAQLIFVAPVTRAFAFSCALTCPNPARDMSTAIAIPF